jgi:hypothetical protein
MCRTVITKARCLIDFGTYDMVERQKYHIQLDHLHFALEETFHIGHDTLVSWSSIHRSHRKVVVGLGGERHIDRETETNILMKKW